MALPTLKQDHELRRELQKYSYEVSRMIIELDPAIGPHWKEFLTELIEIQKMTSDSLHALVLRDYDKSAAIGLQIESKAKSALDNFKFEAKKLELEINFNMVITKYV